MERKEKKGSKLFGLKCTGATIGVAAISLYFSCTLNNPTKNICPFTTIITHFCGYEAGLQHQMHDLENYSSNTKEESYHVRNVEYKEPELFYIIPEGYQFSNNTKGDIVGYKEMIVAKNILTNESIEPTVRSVLLEDGSSQVVYEAPEGYILSKEKDIVDPTIIKGDDAKVIYEYILSENDEMNIYCQSWTYLDGNFVTKPDTFKLKLKKDK